MVEQSTHVTANCASAGRGPDATRRTPKAAPASARWRIAVGRLQQSRIVHPLFVEPCEGPPFACVLSEVIEMRDLFLGTDAGE